MKLLINKYNLDIALNKLTETLYISLLCMAVHSVTTLDYIIFFFYKTFCCTVKQQISWSVVLTVVFDASVHSFIHSLTVHSLNVLKVTAIFNIIKKGISLKNHLPFVAS